MLDDDIVMTTKKIEIVKIPTVMKQLAWYAMPYGIEICASDSLSTFISSLTWAGVAERASWIFSFVRGFDSSAILFAASMSPLAIF